jgi:hypothetical protein
MKRPIAIVSTAFALLVAMASPVTAGQPGPTSDDVSAARTFRAAAGLAHDDSTVQKSLTDPASFPEARFGSPLTRAEAAVVERQMSFSSDYSNVVEIASRMPGYGGGFLDHDTASVLTILTAGDPSQARAAIEPLIPTGGSLIVKTTNRDLRQTDDLVAAIVGRFDDLRAAGFSPHAAHFDFVGSRVIVEVDSAAQETTRALQKWFGTEAVAEVAPRSTLFAGCYIGDCGSKGGLYIEGRKTPTSGFIHGCTSGFVARPSASSSTRLMLTAGHCIWDNGGPTATTSAWTNADITLMWGRNYQSAFHNNSSSDSGTFLLAPASPSIFNQYFVSGTDLRSVSGYVHDSNMLLGQWYCRSGRTSGYDCGKLIVWHQWQDGFACPEGSNCRLNNTMVMEMASSHGDSGAGFIATNRDEVTSAYGVLSGGNPDGADPSTTTFFTTVDAAMSALPIRLCLNASCS